MKLPKGVRVEKIVLAQESDDCAERGDELQRLEIAICDGGAGSYAVLLTERWAIEASEVKELSNLITKLCSDYDEQEILSFEKARQLERSEI